ncbi:MAG: GTPase [Planctomycetota bacterium]|nr:MAG: GTPase [Planctomycetota bacterium]
MSKKVIIMGAAGKDFHTFNMCYRGNKDFEVVAFTATQIPDIDDRRYPPVLAGDLYPEGIPILPEEQLPELIKKHDVDRVVFAYSDVSYDYIEGKKKIVEDAGASFELAPIEETFILSGKPVIAVCAVRTGCGKSQTTRKILRILRDKGRKVVAVRHPMPYGDLSKQICQRFATIEDMERHKCTIEEMEEYEPHIAMGAVVYAGVDYEKILREAEKEADVVLWDGGNNDTPFFKPNLFITVADPHRAGHELTYYPGRVNFEHANVIVINKIDSAEQQGIDTVVANARKHNPGAKIVMAKSPLTVEKPELIKGKRVLVIEDGPTLTHGGMKIGAGMVAARQYEAGEIVDPRPYTVGAITETFRKYPDIGTLLPAMGYSPQQIKDLEETVNACECDSVVIGTPIDLGRIIKIDKPYTRVMYELEEVGSPNLEELLAEF